MTGRLLTFYGVRGSMPTGGKETHRYGAHTTCIAIRLGAKRFLIFDCGTGLRRMQQELPELEHGGCTFSVFITHYHWDHLQGLPFFRPLYDDRNTFRFYGFPWEDLGVAQLIEASFRPPWFPISINEALSRKEFIDLDGGQIVVDDLTITPARLNHPQGVTGYRIDGDGLSVVIATDNERGDPETDESLRRLAAGADVLIHDAQYTPEDYYAHLGWGHSTWKQAIEAARLAEVKHLVLVSHDPDRSDGELDEIAARARAEFGAVDAAHEGMTLRL